MQSVGGTVAPDTSSYLADAAELVRTYSDAGYKIRQVETGVLYIDAVDIEGKYTYVEMNIPALVVEEETEEESVQMEENA